MNVTVLATAAMLLGASVALAANQGAPAQQGGVSTSPGIVGGRTPAETPPPTGMLPGSPGPYKSEGVSSPPVTSAPASPSGSAAQSSTVR
jgi:hypothetical protein